jgi:hypothetical protein
MPKMTTGEILLLAGGAFGLWWYFNQQPAAVPALSTSVASTSAAIPMPVPGASMTSAQQVSNPNATVAQQTTIFNWITSWMDAKSQAAFFAAWPIMTASDIAGLMQWSAGVTGGAPWDAWRQKYQIDIGQ